MHQTFGPRTTGTGTGPNFVGCGFGRAGEAGAKTKAKSEDGGRGAQNWRGEVSVEVVIGCGPGPDGEAGRKNG